MIRQLFLRLVWHIRGIENIIEHFFHNNAFYAFNETHDYFHMRSTYTSNKDKILNPIFVADFIWDDYNEYINNPVIFNADLRIIGTSYYKFDATTVINNMKNISMHDKNSVIFITMPIVKWKFRRKHVKHGNLSEINEWIQSNRYEYLFLN
jgi:hypothetical protein